MGSTINTSLIQLFQFAAILLTGLLAGLFYGYDCSVTKGLGNLQDEGYLQSFQAINKAIVNPFFFISFVGCLLVLPVTCWLSYNNYNTTSFYFILSASLVYFIGVFGITLFCNVPLNEQLANFKISVATESELSSMREAFEVPWNTYHRIRTFASIISFCLMIFSLVKQKI